MPAQLSGLSLLHEYDPAQKKLTLHGASQFPRELLDFASDIEILDMSFGKLSTLPDDFGRLQALRVAFFSFNLFTEVPRVLATCPKLEFIGMRSCRIASWAEDALPPSLQAITLTENELTSVPSSLAKLPHLRKLLLTGNRLRNLPPALENCRQLECIRLCVNEFSASPESLLARLPKLFCYADSGNPFSEHILAPAGNMPSVTWGEIHIGEKIGESAKNAVFRAEYRGGAVAMKVFGNAITTDGLPDDEIRAALAAGEHSALVSATTRVLGMPDDKQAVLMPLIPPSFAPLGLPPDLHTYSRDTFGPEHQFSLAFITGVLRDVASGLQHLHSRGVMHGDVYAHNILANREGQAYLCDFGSACIYQPNQSSVREYIDVRGFGVLIEDLLSRCTETGKQREHLDALEQACCLAEPNRRPRFRDIVKEL
ncbi:MAG TPA: protein kinase [Candidatus Saccharimonadales bacterium]